jgi:hypothetical protein
LEHGHFKGIIIWSLLSGNNGVAQIKSLGDWVEKDELIATIYVYNKNRDIKNEKLLDDANGNNQSKYNNKSNPDKSCEQRIVSYIEISKDRDLSKYLKY